MIDRDLPHLLIVLDMLLLLLTTIPIAIGTISAISIDIHIDISRARRVCYL